MSNNIRNRLQKYMTIIRQMSKVQLIKSSQERDKQTFDKIICCIKNQFNRVKRDIQNDIKMNMTDFDAYLWKLDKFGLAKPIFFENIKINSLNNNESINIEEIKKNFNFPILGYQIKDLIKIGSELLLQNKFCQQNYNSTLITKLVTQISNNYNILPYHNFTHAFSVFMMIIQCKNLSQNITKVYTQFELFITYIAALSHDMNHKGTNSIYQIKKKSDIALLYNNQSILENMHISQFYKICKQFPQIDIISKMKSSIHKQNGKRLFNKLILATDIQGHQKNLKKLQQLTKTKKQLNQLQIHQKQLILQNLFHACDIGNPCLDFNIYMNWSFLVCQQFHQQVNIERIQNLEISSNMEYIDLNTHYRRQIGFIDFLVLPIWKSVSNIFSQLTILKQKVQQNRKQLQNSII